MTKIEVAKVGKVEDWSRHLHKLLDQMQQRRFIQFRGRAVWEPPIDVYESEAQYLVCVELAGMPADQVDVECTDQQHVVISGTRPQPCPAGDRAALSTLVLEIQDGAFRREISLPQRFATDQVAANYRDGFLWISLPKVKA